MLQLIQVHVPEMETLKSYIEALYRLDNDYESMVNIEEGVKSLMRNEALAKAYFIKRSFETIGYVILTRYHSVEKGGLTIFIDELYVESQHRKKGIGKTILKEITQIARNEGAKTLWAQAEPHNDAASAFFISQGFRNNPMKNFELPL